MAVATRLDSVQVLRGLAALAVVLSHIGLELSRFTGQASARQTHLLDLGRAGVDVFFAISGFVMIYVAYGRFGSVRESQRFIIKRLVRIVPVYWLYTTAMLLIASLAPAFLRHSAITVDYVTASYLFIPYRRPGGTEITPLLDLGWTLNYEIYFYAVFACAMLLDRARGLLLLAVVLAGVVLGGSVLQVSSAAPWFWSRPIVFEFLFGVAVGLLYRRGAHLGAAASGSLLACAALWFVLQDAVPGPELRLLRFGIPAALLLAGCVLLRPAAQPARSGVFWRLLLLIGDASYSLYLSHMFVVRVLTKLLAAHLSGPAAGFIYAVAVIAVAVTVATLSYRLVEIPSKNALERILMSLPSRQAAAVR